MNEFLFTQVLTELEDAVGRENCSVKEIDKVTHSVDYFWLSRMWADRGRKMPQADFIVSPKDAQETSKVIKIANYYKIPVTTWGGGGGTQGGAIPVCGGILLDTTRMNKIYEVNTDSMYIECGAGAIYKHVEWAANEKGYATMHYPSSLTCSKPSSLTRVLGALSSLSISAKTFFASLLESTPSFVRLTSSAK